MNFATAFLDGSAVYGSTPKSAEDLRLLESGKLKLDPGRVLAQDPRNVNCRRVTNDNSECLKSGDERVNHNAAVAAIQHHANSNDVRGIDFVAECVELGDT